MTNNVDPSVGQPKFTKKKPIDENCALSVVDFCKVEGISIYTYYALRKRKRDLVPKETRIPTTQIVRISPQARRDWHQRLEQADIQAEVAREFERRAEFASKAGTIAAASPLHHRATVPPKRPRGRPRKHPIAAE